MRWFFWKDDKQQAINDLKSLVASLKTELERYRGYEHYTTLQVPSNEALDSFKTFLGNLYGNQSFAFYLLTLENEMVNLFRDGKGGEDIYRGGLRVIDKIRGDLRAASMEIETKRLAGIVNG